MLPRHRRPLALAAAVAALAAVGVVVLVLRTAGAACAASPVIVASTGKATYFDGSGGGNCSYGPPNTDLYVALGPAEYKAAGACGGYLDVSGPKGTVRVKVVDQCPECQPGHLDLSLAAFKRIGNQVDGIIPVTYQQVRDPRVPGPVTVRVKEGASRYWFAVLVDNHANPLSAVEVKVGGGWQALKRADYNYWLDADGAGPGPFTLRLTDVHGNQAVVGGVTLTPAKVQVTGVWMRGGPAASAPAPSRSSPGPSIPPSAPSEPPAASSEPATTSPAASADGRCR